MKIKMMLKNKRVKVVLVAVLAVMCLSIIIVMATDKVLEEPAAVTAAENVKAEMKVDKGQKHEQRSSDTESRNERRDVDKPKGTSANKTLASADQTASKGGISDRNTDHKASGSDKKNPDSEKAETAEPVHVHDYQRQEGTETVTYEVPIIGDKCSTCNEDITGFAEKHIMDTSCRGYDTDVVVGYDTVTEEVPYIYYKCSCGAVKN